MVVCFVRHTSTYASKPPEPCFVVLTKIQQLEMSVDFQLNLFDHIIQPILLYASEVGGFEKPVMIERIHFKYCRRILRVKQLTPTFMVCGVLRICQPNIIKLRMILYWIKSAGECNGPMYQLHQCNKC